MHLQKSGDKINKLNEKKESVNFEKMFRNVK